MAKLDELLSKATDAAAKVITKERGLGRDSEGATATTETTPASSSSSGSGSAAGT